jgi:hypothetical protein
MTTDILGNFSRRNLMVGLGTVAAAGVIPVTAAKALTPASSDAALARAGYADWTSHTGSRFTLETGHVLELVEVESLPSRDTRPSSVRDQAFVTRFESVRGGALEEGRYVVNHPRGGMFEIFLTPGDKPQRMLAVFN